MRKFIWVVLCAALLVPSSVAAQEWSYSGSNMCYDYGGGVSQCFSHANIEAYVANNRHSISTAESFQNGQQLGQAVGYLAQVLIARWREHQRAVRIETDNLDRQLRGYFDAQNALIDEYLRMMGDDEAQLALLSQMAPERASWFQDRLDETRAQRQKTAQWYDRLRDLEAAELKERKPKALRYFIESPTGAKWRYEAQLKTSSSEYGVNHFLKAVVGYYKQRPQPSKAEGGALHQTAAVLETADTTHALVTVEGAEQQAEIYLDGAFVGNPPAALKVAGGDHLFRVVLGSAEWKRTLTVPAGSDLRLRPAL